jgi:hypothetical protein
MRVRTPCSSGRRRTVAGAVLAVLASASHASNCDAIRAGIDAKIRAAGVPAYTLATLPAEAPTSARVVGRCELGTKKIVYLPQPDAAGTPRPPAGDDRMLTECKDGSVSVGGDCRK